MSGIGYVLGEDVSVEMWWRSVCQHLRYQFAFSYTLGCFPMRPPGDLRSAFEGMNREWFRRTWSED